VKQKNAPFMGRFFVLWQVTLTLAFWVAKVLPVTPSAFWA
jgi:hypothetical protein